MGDTAQMSASDAPAASPGAPHQPPQDRPTAAADRPAAPAESSRGELGRLERRRRVIDAAMSLAGEGGYDAVNMRDVAERAGVAVGSIYRWYSGKDEILTAGLAGWLARTRSRVEAGGARGDTPCERLHWLLDRLADSTEGHRLLICALVQAFNSPDPAVHAHKLEVEQEFRALVVTAIGGDSWAHAAWRGAYAGADAGAYAAGEVRCIDAEGVARLMGHVWTSALNRWASGLASDGSVAKELRHAVELLAAPTAPLGERSAS